MDALQIAPNIYWVGAIHWNLQNFHGYLTQRGSTFNAYLIVDEKITLIDTVKSEFAEEMFARISQVIDPSRIDAVVVNHAEMDHSGALPEFMRRVPKARVICSGKGREGLKAHFGDSPWDYQIVKAGDTLNLGKHSLQFAMTPLVHWPDNMVTYCPEAKILFSNDGFGQHLATFERFNDEVNEGIVWEEARKYFANILLCYAPMVLKELDAIQKFDIRMIATSHGVIWRTKIQEILQAYRDWASNRVQDRAVIVYDSMWGSTEKMAGAVERAFREAGIPAEKLSIQAYHISDIATRILDARWICIGSPTLNNNMLPTVASFVTYLKGLAPKERTGVVFGSYGWSGQSVRSIADALRGTGVEIREEISLQYVPSPKKLEEVTEKIRVLILGRLS